jgi:tetratricopeptide (TPR) repeat protein
VLTLDPENEEAKKRLNDINFILASEEGQSSFPLSITPQAMARAHFVRANELYQSGDYEGAVAEYLRALDLEPANAEILNNLGTAYFAAGKMEQAKTVFEKANKLDANNETIMKNLESARLVESAHKKEKVELQQIKRELQKSESESTETTSVPESATDPKMAGASDRKPAEKMEQAQAKPVVLNPQSLTEKEMTKNTMQRRKPIAARDSSQVHFNMGVFKESEGDLEGALVQYREAVRLEPNNAVAQYNLGNIYFRLGAFESAIECYLAALKADARFSKGYNNIGVAYYKLGRIEEAKRAWKRALQVDPDMQSARENLIKYGGGI